MRGRRKTRGSRADSSFFISYADLMSSILLIFVLVVFYSVYQYFDMLESEAARYLQLSGILEEEREKLDQSTQDLEAQQAKLSEADKQNILQAAELLLKEKQLEDMNAALAAQQSDLDAAKAALDAKEIDLDTARALQAYQQSLLDAQQDKLDNLVGVRTAIIEELITALAKSNISGAQVDDSGAIVFDTEMMFDLGKSNLRDVGKNFLNSFIPNYLKVLMSDDYSKYVSQVIIEGHTDTVGTFLSNMLLSQQRAYAVLNYIMSDEFDGITVGAKKNLLEIVTVNGRSYSDPIYKEDGTIDMDASRRVVIKFRLNDEDMVNEMIAILNGLN